MTLDGLGPRICIMGPSNSGKSTLAEVIGRTKGLKVVHLDQLHHLPSTDWIPRPAPEFAALHDAAIIGEHWVIEGNYSRLLPQRLQGQRGSSFWMLPPRPACTATFGAAGSSGIAAALWREGAIA